MGDTRAMRRVLIATFGVLSLVVPSGAWAQSPGVQAPAVRDAGVRDGGSGRTFGELSEDQILDAIHTARIHGRQFVGSTSINLHLHLAGDIDAGFKPRSLTHADHYRAEIA